MDTYEKEILHNLSIAVSQLDPADLADVPPSIFDLIMLLMDLMNYRSIVWEDEE